MFDYSDLSYCLFQCHIKLLRNMRLFWKRGRYMGVCFFSVWHVYYEALLDIARSASIKL